MSTTMIKLEVNILQKSFTYMTNTLLQIGYRIEHGRGLTGGYMTRLHEVIERGFRTWLTEEKLQIVHFEIFDRSSDKAYEVGKVSLEYTADPTEEDLVVKKPPLEELETLFKRLRQLPPGAQFRVVATTAPGASKVEGWEPTRLRELLGGVSEEIEIGDGHGFGNVRGRTRYLIGNYGQDRP
jgi:hypothetical protein